MKIGMRIVAALCALTLLQAGLAMAGEAAAKPDNSQSPKSPANSGAIAAKEAEPSCTCEEESFCFQGCCDPTWTAQADVLVMKRIGAPDVALIRSSATNEDLLNAKDFDMGFKAGPRLSLIHHGQRCNDLEFTYFSIDGWWEAQSRSDPNGVIFSAPGLTAVSVGSPMQFDYTSKLYSAEANLWVPRGCWKFMGGFRWFELRESLAGQFGLTPNTPFWTTQTDNHLYGVQIGADRVWNPNGRFSLDTVFKIGAYDNRAEQFSGSPILSSAVPAEVEHTAFEGEIGIVGVYHHNEHLSLRLGYQMMWLQGMVLAPSQIAVTNISTGTAGVDTNGAVFYHGAIAGLELKY
jgi:hypothetical protein